MYRKYQSSTKSSRNERLAQLSEQESVIEKKKREILAKFEAQKKKEKEEALRKFEPANLPPNKDKKDSDPPFAKHLLTREKDEEKPMVACPRNAFSNDGSFLDQFKKLSSELGPKNSDFSTAANLMRSCDIRQKLRRDCDKKNRQVLNSYERRENEIDEFKGSLKRKIQNSNFQHQQSPSEFLSQLDNPATQCRKSNNEVLHFASADAKSKVVSRQNILEPAVDAAEQKSENAKSYEFTQMELSCSESPSSVTPQLLQHTAASFEDVVLSTRHFDLIRDEVRLVSNVTKNVFTCLDGMTNEPRNENSSTLSCGGQSPRSDEFSRVSPALNDSEAGNEDKVESTDAINQKSVGDRSRPEYSNNKRSTVGLDEPVELLSNEKSIRGNGEGGLADERTIEEKMKFGNSADNDSIDSNDNSKDSCHCNGRESFNVHLRKMETELSSRDGYQADCDDEISCSNDCHQRIKKTSFHRSSTREFSSQKTDHKDGEDLENQDENEKLEGDNSSSRGRLKRKRKSRWGDEVVEGNSTSTGLNSNVQLPSGIVPASSGPGGKTPMLSKLTRSDPGLIQYARQTFGSTNLSEDDWKKAEDHYKINLLYQDMVKKRAEIDRLEKAGKFKYEYDSDEDVEGGTWEHKLRQQEMMATQLWAEELTRQAAGKHHIGDFLPPEELERFMEKYNAVKQGRNPDLSDYKEFKLKEDNVGYRLLQKMGWNEGQGLGQDGTGITNPVNKATTRHENQGLGVDRPDGLQAGDDEYDAYRKRMMLAYRFRPNPLNNPRRPYY